MLGMMHRGLEKKIKKLEMREVPVISYLMCVTWSFFNINTIGAISVKEHCHDRTCNAECSIAATGQDHEARC